MKGIIVTPQVKNLVYDQLDFIGVSPRLKGYEYAAALVCKVLENPENLFCISYMYQVVGDTLETTGSRVERGIRHAVEATFNRIGITSPLWSWFSYVDPQKGKPTNKEFVATISKMVRKEISEVDSEIPGQTQIEGVN